MQDRKLVPHYFISTKVVGWRCTGCGRLFSVPFQELAFTIHDPPPARLVEEFRAHACEQAESAENAAN